MAVVLGSDREWGFHQPATLGNSLHIDRALFFWLRNGNAMPTCQIYPPNTPNVGMYPPLRCTHLHLHCTEQCQDACTQTFTRSTYGKPCKHKCGCVYRFFHLSFYPPNVMSCVNALTYPHSCTPHQMGYLTHQNMLGFGVCCCWSDVKSLFSTLEAWDCDLRHRRKRH